VFLTIFVIVFFITITYFALKKPIVNNVNNNINNYDNILFKFNKVNNLDDFTSILDKYSGDVLSVIIFKENTNILYKKYFSYVFDYYLKKDDKQILTFIKNNWGKVEDTRNKFIDFISSKKITNITKQVSLEDLELDYIVYFNNISLKDALYNCKRLIWIKPEYDNTLFCENKIYFYRANKVNNYCNNIIKDTLMKDVCYDSLK